MSNTVAQRLVAFAVSGIFLLACASGGANGAGELNGARAQSYTLTCAESSCDSCREAARDRYSECLELCSNPNAPAGCFSQCSSIGDSSCPYACGDNERCDDWQADLPLPERDEDFFVACTERGLACTKASQKYLDARCDQEARLQQPRFAKEYECALAHECDLDGAAHCLTHPEAGTIGTLICERAEACRNACRAGDDQTLSDEAFINSFEGKLRPSLVAIAKRCAAEQECDKFIACKSALDDLWWLEQHNYLMD